MHANPRIPTRTALAIAACLLLGSAAALLGTTAGAADAPANAVRPALTVTTAQPQPASVPLRIAANGNIAAWQEASVGAEVNGLRLAEVRVNVGDVVKKGQVLARFAPETVNADVAQSRASLAEAEASYADAQGNAERARTLQNTGALSQQQINQYMTAAKTALARVEAARAVLAAQRVRQGNANVLAPDAGVISARSATVGGVVGAGTELFRLIRGSRLEWRAEVTSNELGRIRPGTKATVVAASGAQVQGTVRAIAPTVDPATRNAIVYVDLPVHPDAKAGMFARGDFDLGASQALTVPQQAVVARDGFSYVFAVVPAQARPPTADAKDKKDAPPAPPATNTQVRQTKVETGRRVGDRVEILRGIDARATIAVQGAGFLNDGDLVRVAAAPQAAPAGAAATPQAAPSGAVAAPQAAPAGAAAATNAPAASVLPSSPATK